uniref:Uncharacterized protein n=1 Tax=Falco tinnunculus TaxID=100819 RepID=A0A8C4TYU8_FALTI
MRRGGCTSSACQGPWGPHRLPGSPALPKQPSDPTPHGQSSHSPGPASALAPTSTGPCIPGPALPCPNPTANYFRHPQLLASLHSRVPPAHLPPQPARELTHVWGFLLGGCSRECKTHSVHLFPLPPGSLLCSG